MKEYSAWQQSDPEPAVPARATEPPSQPFAGYSVWNPDAVPVAAAPALVTDYRTRQVAPEAGYTIWVQPAELAAVAPAAGAGVAGPALEDLVAWAPMFHVWSPRDPAQPPVVSDVWVWSTQTAVPPGSGQVRTNSGTWTTATILYIDRRTAAGTDVGSTLAGSKAGDTIRLQHNTDATRFARFNVTAPPTLVQTGYSYPVQYTDGGGTLPNSSTQILVTLNTNALLRAQVQPMLDRLDQLEARVAALEALA